MGRGGMGEDLGMLARACKIFFGILEDAYKMSKIRKREGSQTKKHSPVEGMASSIAPS